MSQTIANANALRNSISALTFCYRGDDDSWMENDPPRIAILRKLVGEHPTVAAFARTYDVDVTYIRQLLSGHRNLGEKAAKKLGTKIANNPDLFESPTPASVSPGPDVRGQLPPEDAAHLDDLNELLPEDAARFREMIRMEADKARRYRGKPTRTGQTDPDRRTEPDAPPLPKDRRAA